MESRSDEIILPNAQKVTFQNEELINDSKPIYNGLTENQCIMI